MLASTWRRGEMGKARSNVGSSSAYRLYEYFDVLTCFLKDTQHLTFMLQ